MSARELELLSAGCRAFFLEIVRRAIADWVLYRGHRRLKNRLLAEDAYFWLFEETLDGATAKERAREGKEATSFLAICETLDLDPEKLRTRIRQLTPKDVLSVGRPPTHRRPPVASKEDEEDLPSPDDVVDIRDVNRAALTESNAGSDAMFTARPVPLRSWGSRYGGRR